jgi:hypothetical protein
MAAARVIAGTERTASKERTRGTARPRVVGTKREVTGSCRNVALSKGDIGGAKPPKNAGWRSKRQSRIRKEPVMNEGITFVGFDAHKASISVAMLLPNAVTPVEWQLPNEASAVRRMVRRIEREAPGEVRTCYEAGPCGYALQRQITESGDASCMVVAPSLIPRKPGERIKTDRRDARKLASCFERACSPRCSRPASVTRRIYRDQRRRMQTGTIRRTRAVAMRQRAALIRDSRQRHLPTEHGHVALRRLVGATREYQSDSSSKRPVSSVVSGPCGRNP